MKNDSAYLERYSAGWSSDSLRLFVTPSQFAKSSYFYAQECGYFKTDDTYFTERRNLKSYLLVYTLSGTGHLRYEGSEYTLTEGDCFYINCMEKHLYFTPPGHTWEFLWVHFDGPVSLGYYKHFIQNGFKTVHIQNTELVESSLRRLISINQNRTVTTEVVTSCLLTSVLTELTIQSVTNNAPFVLLPDSIKSVMTDIDQNFKSELSLESLAFHHGLSKFHLAREFKKYTGSTVNEYIITCRIAYAKELLKYSDIPIGEIASMCGIINVSHFINLFKSREGITPLSYRKSWK